MEDVAQKNPLYEDVLTLPGRAYYRQERFRDALLVFQWRLRRALLTFEWPGTKSHWQGHPSVRKYGLGRKESFIRFGENILDHINNEESTQILDGDFRRSMPGLFDDETSQ